MAFVRSRKRKSGTYWYVVDTVPVASQDGKTRWKKQTRAAGQGKDGREFAQEWAESLRKARRRLKAGLPPEQTRCRWTLGDLRERDLADARARGLVSLKRRRSHWDALTGIFGEDLNLDQLTPAALERYGRERMRRGRLMAGGNVRPVGPAAVNRDLRSVLSPALKLARRLWDESGYTGRPFADLPQLEERSHRRSPRPLTAAEAVRLVAAAWKVADRAPEPWRPSWRQDAAILELLLVTASRRGQILALRKDQIRGGILFFPAQKRGKERAFVLTPRVRAVLRHAGGSKGPWVFEGRHGGHRVEFRRFWQAATKAAGLPGLKPHDLRHTASHEALRRSRDIGAVQGLLGHATPAATQAVYLRLRPRRLMPLTFGGREVARDTLKNARPGRKGRQPRA